MSEGTCTVLRTYLPTIRYCVLYGTAYMYGTAYVPTSCVSFAPSYDVHVGRFVVRGWIGNDLSLQNQSHVCERMFFSNSMSFLTYG